MSIHWVQGTIVCCALHSSQHKSQRCVLYYFDLISTANCVRKRRAQLNATICNAASALFGHRSSHAPFSTIFPTRRKSIENLKTLGCTMLTNVPKCISDKKTHLTGRHQRLCVRKQNVVQTLRWRSHPIRYLKALVWRVGYRVCR